MVKNLFLLGLLSWVCFSYAKEPSIVRDTIVDAESYKIEKPAPEQEAQRSVAGAKIKKQKKSEVKADEPSKSAPSETDSEVHYWQYSE